MPTPPRDPPDYTSVSEESPREAIANTVMQIRGAEQGLYDHGIEIAIPELQRWASRLEDACRKLDARRRSEIAHWHNLVTPDEPRGDEP